MRRMRQKLGSYAFCENRSTDKCKVKTNPTNIVVASDTPTARQQPNHEAILVVPREL